MIGGVNFLREKLVSISFMIRLLSCRPLRGSSAAQRRNFTKGGWVFQIFEIKIIEFVSNSNNI